jgi:hypothetical protein
MSTTAVWKHSDRKPKSLYKQLFVKDRWVAARTLHGQSQGEDARTPAELAADFGLSVEAVLEAIAYCESPPEIQEDWQREQALSHAIGTDDPNYRYHATPSGAFPQGFRTEGARHGSPGLARGASAALGQEGRPSMCCTLKACG